MTPPKYICAHCRKPLFFRQRGGVFKFVHHRRAQDIACDADVARLAAEEICPPAIVDASEGYTEAEIREAKDRVQLEEWALEARAGTINVALATYLDENMPGWRDL